MTDDLDKLIEARRKIDRALLERHSVEMAVMFTDMVGSTQFFEERGDIDGLALLRRHNDLLFPVVERHRGRVVKTVGDAIMAVFDEPTDGVRCAAEMQRTLVETNTEHPAEPIRVRIGVHSGRVMRDGEDVFGDAVNTAARIAHEADGGEILLSRTLYERLPETRGLGARPRGALKLKGKAEPLPVVELVWHDEDAAQAARLAAADRSEVFVLELGVGPAGLKVAALDGAQDKGTVKAYAEVPLSVMGLDALGQKFEPFLKGESSARFVDEIQERGEALFGESLSERARQHLAATGLCYLRLHLDDELVHLPWELMHDGQGFLGLRFAVGRMVTARSDVSPYEGTTGEDSGAGHVLVVSNPTGDLRAAAREGEAVAKLLGDRFSGEVRHLAGPVNREALLKNLTGCRLLHFAGHAVEASAEAPGGLELADGVVLPEEAAASLGAPPPALVFANSCHSATSAGWKATARGVFNLASALLMRGARHYLAPMWAVPDDDALNFSLRFYEQALAGVPLGEAVRQARKSLRDPSSAGGYVLYGEPRDVLVASRPQLGQRRRSADDEPRAVPETPREEAPAAASEPGAARRDRRKLRYGAWIVLALAAAWAITWKLIGDDPPLPSETAPAWPAQPPRPPGIPAVGGRPAVPAVPGAHAPQPPQPPGAKAPPGAGPDWTATPPKPGAGATAATTPREGPLRLSMLDFKNLTGEAKLAFLSGGIAETLITDFGQRKDVRLIERGQIELDLDEIDFGQSQYVDPATRAALGKIVGAEVVVLGGYQKAGNTIRATARFIDVETGEVLSALRLERPAKQIFELQDALAVEVRRATDEVIKRLRP